VSASAQLNVMPGVNLWL